MPIWLFPVQAVCRYCCCRCSQFRSCRCLHWRIRVQIAQVCKSEVGCYPALNNPTLPLPELVRQCRFGCFQFRPFADRHRRGRRHRRRRRDWRVGSDGVNGSARGADGHPAAPAELAVPAEKVGTAGTAGPHPTASPAAKGHRRGRRHRRRRRDWRVGSDGVNGSARGADGHPVRPHGQKGRHLRMHGEHRRHLKARDRDLPGTTRVIKAQAGVQQVLTR